MITELKYKVRQVSSFVDESFDTKDLAGYHLILQAGTDGLLAAVLDRDKNKYIGFEYFSFQQIFSQELISDLYGIASNESSIIPLKYPSVSFSIVNNHSTLIPSALYDENHSRSYLSLGSAIQNDDLVLSDSIRNQDAVNVFAMPLSLKSKIDSVYPRVKYHHFSSSLIEGLLALNRNQSKKRLYLHVQPSHFEAVIIDGKSLLYYNTFNYHTAEDFIYYTLFVCEQLHLNPETTETILIGEIERTSTIFSLTQKYVRSLKFGDRNDSSDFGYQLQTLPKHSYFSLFNSYLT
ncbi:MAG TPA: DUF3822 family protein [Bacteroidia bacterium]|jgi:hypothetical protein